MEELSYRVEGSPQRPHQQTTIIFEVVATKDLWIWHSLFCLPGFHNDLNVLSRSSLFARLIIGDIHACNYSVNGQIYSWVTTLQMASIHNGPAWSKQFGIQKVTKIFTLPNVKKLLGKTWRDPSVCYRSALQLFVVLPSMRALWFYGRSWFVASYCIT